MCKSKFLLTVILFSLLTIASFGADGGISPGSGIYLSDGRSEICLYKATEKEVCSCMGNPSKTEIVNEEKILYYKKDLVFHFNKDELLELITINTPSYKTMYATGVGSTLKDIRKNFIYGKIVDNKYFAVGISFSFDPKTEVITSIDIFTKEPKKAYSINDIKDFKTLTIIINNNKYTGERMLKNGVLYILLSDLKTFLLNFNYKFDYKIESKKLFLIDYESTYEYDGNFIKESYDIYVPLKELFETLGFSYKYKPVPIVDEFSLIPEENRDKTENVIEFFKNRNIPTGNTFYNDQPDLSLGDWGFVKEEAFHYLVGKVTNNSSKTFKAVFIKFNLYDSHGNIVGDAIDSCNNFAPNDTWVFKAAAIGNDVETAKVTELKGYNY